MNVKDIREIPAYSFAEAAHYLRMPRSTLRSWFLGQSYETGFFKPVITIADKKRKRLSFINLVESHVLDAIRRKHKISLPKARKALEYLRKKFPSDHPLADQQFATDGLSLFIDRYGQLVNISKSGQLAMRDILTAYLHRIERDPSGIPSKIYLFTRKRQPDEPRTVMIDPNISFGRPVLAGTGIATAVLAERYKAGDSIADLTRDYGRESSEIEEAIRCELDLEAA